MARVADPAKGFNFSIFTPGLNPYLAQEVTVPDVELEQVEHGDDGYDVKTAGKMKVGNITINKLKSVTSGENWIWNWIQDIRDTFVGGGDLPQIYKRSIIIVGFAYDGFTVIDKWECFGCWPQKINGVEYKRTASDNIITSIELSVDRVYKSL